MTRRPAARRHGLTLIEVMIVAMVTALIATPMWLILRAGTRSSLQGMLHIDTTIEARNVLAQVHRDLKAALFPTAGWNVDVADNEQLLDPVAPPPAAVLRLLVFPPPAAFADAHAAAPGEEHVLCAHRITYRLVRNAPPEHGFTLWRDEEGNPAARAGPASASHPLSKRVNYFQIRREPLRHRDERGRDTVTAVYRVTLQLVEAMPDAAPLPETVGQRLQAPRGVVVADFFDVVFSEFLHAKRLQPFVAQNWNTGVAGFHDGCEPPW